LLIPNWQRIVPLSGPLFVVFLLASIVLTAVPGGDEGNEELLAWYTDSGNRISAMFSGYLLVLAALSLLVFALHLRWLIGRSSGEGNVLGTAALAGGLGAALFLVATSVALAAIPASVELADGPVPVTPDVPRAINSVGFDLMLIGAMFMAIFMIVATAVASAQHDIFPRWFTWLSGVCAFSLVFAAVWLPALALPIWMLTASVLTYRRERGVVAPSMVPAT
jgi:hypothetical protein